MPILKLSNDIKKYALESIRVPISILGDCPQCQSSGYRDGICGDCNYIDPRVMEAIQEWQQAMGIQQNVRNEVQQKKEMALEGGMPKAAYRSLSFVDVLPSIPSAKVQCPSCKQNTFVVPVSNSKGYVKKKDVYKDGGDCENPACKHEIAGALGFKRPKFLNLDKDWLKETGGVRRNFLTPSQASEKIERNKKTLKKSAKGQMDTGALLDDSMVVLTDPIEKMDQVIQDKALIDSQNKNENEK